VIRRVNLLSRPFSKGYYIILSGWLTYWLAKLGYQRPFHISAPYAFYLTMAIITATIWVVVTWKRLAYLQISKMWFLLLSCPWVLLIWAVQRGGTPLVGVCMLITLIAQIALILLMPLGNRGS
jgi:uncharacterized membrane protein YhaH (DUF805 family)